MYVTMYVCMYYDLMWRCYRCYRLGSWHIRYVFEGNLEVKLPAIWTDEQQRWEESEKKVRRESQIRKKRSMKRKSQVRAKVGKSRRTVFFQFWKSSSQTNIGRGQSAPLFYPIFFLGGISLCSPNSFWERGSRQPYLITLFWGGKGLLSPNSP